MSIIEPNSKLSEQQGEHLLVLLRYLAAADRRLSDSEVEHARLAYTQFTGRETNAGPFQQRFRNVQSSDGQAYESAKSLSGLPDGVRAHMLTNLSNMAGVDESVTRTEERRLVRIRKGLMFEDGRGATPTVSREG